MQWILTGSRLNILCLLYRYARDNDREVILPGQFLLSGNVDSNATTMLLCSSHNTLQLENCKAGTIYINAVYENGAYEVRTSIVKSKRVPREKMASSTEILCGGMPDNAAGSDSAR